MPGARRTRSLVCKDRKHTSVVTAGTPDATRHSLHDGVTAYFVLSPVTGLFVTVRQRDCRGNRRQLERQHRGVRTTRLRRPKIARSSSAQNFGHRIPRPTSVTIAIRPSL
jgi:hypothetical protein